MSCISDLTRIFIERAREPMTVILRPAPGADLQSFLEGQQILYFTLQDRDHLQRTVTLGYKAEVTREQVRLLEESGLVESLFTDARSNATAWGDRPRYE